MKTSILKAACIPILLLLTGTSALSQKIPDALQQRIAGKTNLQEIMKEVDEFYDFGRSPLLKEGRKGTEEEKEFENAYVHWKRFEQFYLNRVDQNGNIPSNVTKLMWDGWNKYRTEHPQHFNQNTNSPNIAYGNWVNFGPTSIIRYGVGYNSGYGRVNCIAFDPVDENKYYIGLPQGGIWRTLDNGANWSVLTDDLPSTGISGLVVSFSNANILYALTGDGDVSHGNLITSYGFDQKSVGVLKSTDGGANWFQTGDLPNAGTNYYGYKLIQHPGNANILFAATTAGIYRTTNAGTSWTQEQTGVFTDIEFKPGDPNTMYAVRRGGASPFFKSTDGGATWSNAGITGVPGTAERLAIGVSAANSAYVYLLTGPATGSGSFRGVYRSTNSGDDFTLRTNTPNILGYPTDGSDNSDQTQYDLAIEVDPNNANEVITGGINIWRSTDGGATFVAETQWFDDVADVPPGDYVHADIHNLTFHRLNTNKIFACSDGGVGISLNDGATWSFISPDLHILATYKADWYEANAEILATGTQDNGTNVRYVASNTYRHIFGADGFDCLIDQTNSNDIVFVHNGNISRTTDGGLTRNLKSPAGLGFFPSLARSFADDNDIFAGDGNNVYRSTNRGDNWTTETTPAGSRVLTTCVSNASRVYAGNGTSFWRSDDAGDTWALKSGTPGYPTGVNMTDVEAVITNSLDIYASFGGYSDGNKVFFSTDGGDNWINISGSLPNVACHSIAVDENNTVYVGTDIGVFVRPSTESDWQPFLNNLPKTPVSELLINNTSNRIIACTYGRGNWYSEYYTPCSAVGTLIVSTNLTGYRFYEYNSISSTSTITGGVGTNVLMKGNDYVDLMPGFVAFSGNLFKAYVGPCGNGGVQFLQNMQEELPMQGIFFNAENGKRWPYARIKNVDRANTTVTIGVETAGDYSLRITDENGKLVSLVFIDRKMDKGDIDYSIQPFIPAGNGLYYLQLFKGLQLVHLQELDLITR
jgi:photosystem II stability/assembly factor-like uncharacterized protein